MQLNKDSSGGYSLAAVFLLSLFSQLVVAGQPLRLRPLSVFRHGEIVDGGGAEIVKFSAETKCLYVVNREHNSIDILAIENPVEPKLKLRIDLGPFGESATHVAVHGQLIAVSLPGIPTTASGGVAFFNQNGKSLGRVSTGPLPDMISFTPDGRFIVTADEGEPSPDYSIDPEGSVTIIQLPADAYTNDQVTISDATCKIRMADFKGFDTSQIPAGVRIGKPNATVAEDLEPEYLTISPDGKTAWVVLQENNALAVVDLEAAKVTKLLPLGEKSFQPSGDSSGIDVSDIDQTISLVNWPLFAFYQPDGIASFTTGGETYLVTANEGDHRSYGTFRDVARVSELLLDPNVFPNANELKRPENMGRLLVSSVDGDIDNDGLHESLYTFGARSFSIWNTQGKLVYDSGSQLELLIAEQYPDQFNSNSSDASFDDRSDDKGPEPEGVTIGQVADRTLAFIGIERFSGILVVDVTNPSEPVVIELYRQRVADAEIMDHAPEGLAFIAADDSPNGKPLLAVAYEVSGTTRIYQVGE